MPRLSPSLISLYATEYGVRLEDGLLPTQVHTEYFPDRLRSFGSRIIRRFGALHDVTVTSRFADFRMTLQ
jgi:hypothetical protein